MKEYVLNYYPKFKCIAEKCKHTCCAGWEMCIDQKTLATYKTHSSPFASALKSGVNYKKSKFKMDKLGRCAFLNDKGLCEIILNIGEQNLCQVCKDHPRFRSFFDDRVEMGLGFSCEQATRVILSFTDKISPTLTCDDQTETALDFNQKNLLEFRRKALDVIQDRTTCINQRVQLLLSLCKTDLTYLEPKKVIKAFISTERLDKSWTKRLKSLKKKPFDLNISDTLSLQAEQFLVNSIYRHLYDAEDTLSVRARTIFCVLSWLIIQNVIANEQPTTDEFELIVDVVRAYSAEIEYSQKNLDKLFNFAYKLIKL